MSITTATPTRLTAPLPPAARDALARLEMAFAPTPTVLMEFPTASGAVEVQAVRGDYLPYRWVCPAGCDAGDGYRALPFCRDDAKAHAETCPGVEGDAAASEYEACASRYRDLAAHAGSLCGSEFDRMLCVVDEMGHCRDRLAAAGRLDLLADEHGKTKDPLPSRPRGPHPQSVKAVA